jgi:hypothetical protein
VRVAGLPQWKEHHHACGRLIKEDARHPRNWVAHVGHAQCLPAELVAPGL